MLNTEESNQFFTSLKKSLSIKRFSGYLGKGTELDAFAKYLWNIDLCESLCPCFQLLEVAFRNNVHDQIGIAIKEPNWIQNEHAVFAHEHETIKKAKESLGMGGISPTEDYLISEMKFGFWTSLLNSRYETLWHKIIAGVFPNMPKSKRTRGDASVLMHGVRQLRNAALHHHSIWHWHDLKTQHEQMRQLIDHICASSAAIAVQIDRFPAAYLSGMNKCQKTAAKILASVQKPEILPIPPNNVPVK